MWRENTNSGSNSLSLHYILQNAINMGASDVHLQVNSPAMFRLQGNLLTFRDVLLTSEDLRRFSNEVLSAHQRKLLHEGANVDIGYGDERLNRRFRFNFSRSRGEIVIAIRIISLEIPDFQFLNLPPIIRKISEYRRGLVLVVGTTGSGKSTTLAAMIRHISTMQKNHIVTIEDPVEYVFKQNVGLITQQEVGKDIANFKTAMRNVLRQDPDVIVIGEMRDKETIEAALLAAETGHLVISTLHTLDAAETIHRIISVYDDGHQDQVRQQLASILRAVVGLRLVPKKDSNSLLPAVEVLLNNDRIKDMIMKPERIHEITDAIEESHDSFKMQSFDQSLMSLLSRNMITYQTAINNVSRPGLFELRYKEGVHSAGGEKKWIGFEERQATFRGPPLQPANPMSGPENKSITKSQPSMKATGTDGATVSNILPLRLRKPLV